MLTRVQSGDKNNDNNGQPIIPIKKFKNRVMLKMRHGNRGYCNMLGVQVGYKEDTF